MRIRRTVTAIVSVSALILISAPLATGAPLSAPRWFELVRRKRGDGEVGHRGRVPAGLADAGATISSAPRQVPVVSGVNVATMPAHGNSPSLNGPNAASTASADCTVTITGNGTSVELRPSTSPSPPLHLGHECRRSTATTQRWRPVRREAAQAADEQEGHVISPVLTTEAAFPTSCAVVRSDAVQRPGEPGPVPAVLKVKATSKPQDPRTQRAEDRPSTMGGRRNCRALPIAAVPAGAIWSPGVLFQDIFIACPATCLSLEGRRFAACRSSGSSSRRSWRASPRGRSPGSTGSPSRGCPSSWRPGARAAGTALEPQSRRPRSNPNATPPDVVDQVLALRAELTADGCDAGPHSIAGILDDGWTPRRGDDDLADPDPCRRDHPRAAQATQALVDPIRGRPAERVLAGRLHPRQARHRPRRRSAALGRRPLPLPDLRHRPRPRHRTHRRGHLPRRLHGPRHPAIHVDRQRIRLHHPPPQRPQRLRGRTARPSASRRRTAPPTTPRPRARSSASTRPSSSGWAPAPPPRTWPPSKRCSTSSPTTTTTGASTAP